MVHVLRTICFAVVGVHYVLPAVCHRISRKKEVRFLRAGVAVVVGGGVVIAVAALYYRTALCCCGLIIKAFKMKILLQLPSVVVQHLMLFHR